MRGARSTDCCGLHNALTFRLSRSKHHNLTQTFRTGLQIVISLTKFAALLDFTMELKLCYTLLWIMLTSKCLLVSITADSDANKASI